MMKSHKERKIFEQIATDITGISPIIDYEYQALSYSKTKKGINKQHRKNLFKSDKRVI